MPDDSRGPLIYENWKAADRGEPERNAFEFPLVSDSNVAGEIVDGLGPYSIINSVAAFPPREGTSVLFLRYTDHRAPDDGPTLPERTDAERYHGGGLPDEISALLSLGLGFRLWAGSMSRRFSSADGPLGRPISLEIEERPLIRRARRHAAQLPHLARSFAISLSPNLSSVPDLSPLHATALVKAARLFQKALWIADADPQMSWLLFVSAVEVAALRWRQDSGSATDRLQFSMPDLAALLTETGGRAHLDAVAEKLVDYLGATRRFVEFLLEFLPQPLEPRPPEGLALNWARESLQRSFRVVYTWRSRALHGGIAFPAPMCQPPSRVHDQVIEIPLGLATGNADVMWRAEDTPMLLHTFAYIVRGALRAWWSTLARSE